MTSNITDIKIMIMLYAVITWFYLHMIKYESLYAYQFFHMFWGSYENVKLIYIWIFMHHDLHNYYISIYMYMYSIMNVCQNVIDFLIRSVTNKDIM